MTPDFYDEDEQGRPTDEKGRTWIECERCYGEGCYLYSEGDPSDWGEDCPSEMDHVIPCCDCGGQGGWWMKLKKESEVQS